MASGLSSNVSKTTVIGINCSLTESSLWVSSFSCKVDSLPFSYLGGNQWTTSLWALVVDKMHNRLQKWKSLVLSKGGKLTLAQSVLNSIPIYYFSILKATEVVIKSMEKLTRNFIWIGRAHKPMGNLEMVLVCFAA